MQLKYKILLLIFFLLGMVYFLTAKGHMAVSDSAFSLRTAKAIIENGSLEINATESEKGWVFITSEGKIYSAYGIGLVLLWIPYVLLGKATALSTGLLESRVISFLISFYNIFFGAGACVMMFYILRFFKASNKIATIMALLLGLGTICWRYSVWDFSEATQMFFLTGAVYFILKSTKNSLIAASIFLSYLILIKVVYIIFIPVFVIYLLAKDGKADKSNLRLLFPFSSFIIATIIFILFLNYIRFGNIFETGYGGFALKFSLIRIPRNIINLLFSLNKGMFVYNPILLLGILGYFNFFKLYKKEAIFFFSVIALSLYVYAQYAHWEGGWSWGPRFLVPTIPLWLLPLYIFLDRKGAVKWILTSFIFVSLVVQLISVLQNEHEYHQIRYSIVGTINNGFTEKMPADIIGSAIILKHKLFREDNVYNLSEFGIDYDAKIDTSGFETCRGLNLWYCHLARFYNKPLIKYIPIVFLPFIVCLFISLIRTAAALDNKVSV